MQINLNKFDLHMIQHGIGFCISASVQSILHYHKPHLHFSQDYLHSLMVIGEQNQQPSFPAVLRNIKPKLDKEFDFQIPPEPQNFLEWSQNIKTEIDNSNPLAISTRVGPTSVHIRVVVGYDNAKKEFKLYNPGVTYLKNNGSTPGFQFSIKSFIEDYTYFNAESDFNVHQPTRDQLIIHPI